VDARGSSTAVTRRARLCCGPLRGSASAVSPQGLGPGVRPDPSGTVFSMTAPRAGITPGRATAPRIPLQVTRTSWRRGCCDDASTPRPRPPEAWRRRTLGRGHRRCPKGRRRLGGGHQPGCLLRICASPCRPTCSRAKSSITLQYSSLARPDYQSRLRAWPAVIGRPGAEYRPPVLGGSAEGRQQLSASPTICPPSPLLKPPERARVAR